MLRTIPVACRVGGLLVSFASIAGAQPVELEAGTTRSVPPGPGQPCIVGIDKREERSTTKAEADCVFESGGLRAWLLMDSGSGVNAVDASVEVKVVVLQFQVPSTPSGASYVPFHAVVPVSWMGRFFNATVVGASGTTTAAASVNMYLRLRESLAADVNFAGPLLSQSRFQGASHGGISNCLTITESEVSAVVMLVGCGFAAWQPDEGKVPAEISGVIRTGQVYNLELVMRGDLTAPFTLNPPGALLTERINFKDDVAEIFQDDVFGLIWRQRATIRIGSDPALAVDDLRLELDALGAIVAELRGDFDGHSHTYRTGAGEGHNSVEAQTPPPQ